MYSGYPLGRGFFLPPPLYRAVTAAVAAAVAATEVAYARALCASPFGGISESVCRFHSLSLSRSPFYRGAAKSKDVAGLDDGERSVKEWNAIDSAFSQPSLKYFLVP